MSWLLLLALGCGDKDPGPDTGTSPTTGTTTLTGDRVERFTALAERAGWTVQEGRFNFLQLDECCEPDANCLWNNPSTPYGFYAFPPADGQTGPDRMQLDDGTARSFHLREDHVLVLLGQTPPEARYYSLRSYLSWRMSGPTPELVIGSLGPSLNHEVVEDRTGADPFDREVAVVTSTDATLEAEIHGLLEQAGLPAADILDDRIPPELVQLGLDDEADQFMVVTRTAMIADPAVEEAWYDDPELTLLRLSPETPRTLEAPHPIPALPTRGTGTDEAELADALDALGEAILARYADQVPVEQVATHWWFETLDCIDDGHCSGDIRDRHYSRVPNFTLPDASVFAVAYGVNHERTGKATYSNMAVDTVIGAIGLDALNSDQMVGTAAEYLPDHPQVDDLYAVVIARDCAARPELHCIEVPMECPGVAPEEPMLVSFRSYLEPETGAAPADDEILKDRVIRFTSPGTGTTTSP